MGQVPPLSFRLLIQWDMSHIDLPTPIVLGIDCNDIRNLHFAKHQEENMQYF